MLETMQRTIEHTRPGLAPGNVEECVCASGECLVLESLGNLGRQKTHALTHACTHLL